jgi:hypothetical protein
VATELEELFEEKDNLWRYFDDNKTKARALSREKMSLLTGE